MIAILKGQLNSPARRTALAGYVNLGVMLVVGVLSLRMALKYLSDEECGVWNALSGSLGLFLLLDFGVSSAASRMIAEPLGRGDQPEVDSWWSAIVTVMAAQGAILFLLGMVCQHLLLAWLFKVPAHLLRDAQLLWYTMIASAALKIPFQAYASILFCQNRFYHMYLGTALSGLVNFLLFILFLKLGYGLKSYMTAYACSVLVMIVWWLWAVRKSRVVLHFDRRSFSREKLKTLFGYSNHVFVANFSTQASTIVQSMIISNLFGVAALNPFNVSTRSSGIIGQVLARTSEAKVPGWWSLHLDGKSPQVAAEFSRLAKWLIPLVFFSAAGLMVFNRGFITLVFNRPDVYEGRAFDAMVALLLIVQQILKATQFIFPMSGKAGGWAAISVVDALLTVAFGYVFGRLWGPWGLVFGSALGSLISSVPFTLLAMPRLLLVSFRECCGKLLWDSLAGSAAVAAIWLILARDQASGWFPSTPEWAGSVVLSMLGIWLVFRLVEGGMLPSPRRLMGLRNPPAA
ncbi:MAG: hypothetical protein JWO82_980 [Akkermansiaceae bacterium]|nr:hypothetical protein [Akkermansiaceae bacterium]